MVVLVIFHLADIHIDYCCGRPTFAPSFVRHHLYISNSSRGSEFIPITVVSVSSFRIFASSILAFYSNFQIVESWSIHVKVSLIVSGPLSSTRDPRVWFGVHMPLHERTTQFAFWSYTNYSDTADICNPADSPCTSLSYSQKKNKLMNDNITDASDR